MKRYLTLFFLLITSIALCAYPEGAINNIDGSVLGWDNASQTWRPIAVNAEGKLSGGDSPTIASISIDTSNIDNKLVATYTTQFDTYQQTVGEMLKNISQYYGNDSGSINQNIFSILNDLVMQYSMITSIGQYLSELVKTSQPDILKTVRLNLSANTATQVSPISVTGNRNRVFVELRAIDENALFYIGFDSSVTDSNGRPVKGRILLNMPSSQALYVYHTNSSAIDVQQTEGWR